MKFNPHDAEIRLIGRTISTCNVRIYNTNHAGIVMVDKPELVLPLSSRIRPYQQYLHQFSEDKLSYVITNVITDAKTVSSDLRPVKNVLNETGLLLFEQQETVTENAKIMRYNNLDSGLVLQNNKEVIRLERTGNYLSNIVKNGNYLRSRGIGENIIQIAEIETQLRNKLPSFTIDELHEMSETAQKYSKLNIKQKCSVEESARVHTQMMEDRKKVETIRRGGGFIRNYNSPNFPIQNPDQGDEEEMREFDNVHMKSESKSESVLEEGQGKIKKKRGGVHEETKEETKEEVEE